MILKDLLNRIDDNTGVRIYDSVGEELLDYDFADMIHKRYLDHEVIFPISVRDNKIDIWIETDNDVI